MADETARIVEYCTNAGGRTPTPDVTDQLKRHLLDTVGVAIGASTHASSSQVFEAGFEALSSSGTAGEATRLPGGDRTTAEAAALTNGTLAHSLDFDDTHRESSLHPGAPIIPAALALAEREGASTEHLLRALNVGYDVACALGRAINPDAHYARGFHITATCGTFGVTAAAGVILDFDAGTFADAFGLNGSQAAGSLQFLANGAWNKRLHPGLAARRGITAATLAEAGVRGAAEPLEGENGFFVGYTDEANPAALADIGERSAVMETALKPYPCCRYMHPALDALCDISTAVDPTAVTAIRVELPRSGVKLTGDPIEDKQRPENFVDCQFSMPFGAALALTTGDAGLRAFLDAQPKLDDPELRRLMDLTEVTATDHVQSLFPEQWAARVVVEAGDETHERFVDTARGEPERPLSWDAVTEKFDELAHGPGFPAHQRERIVSVVKDLEHHEIDDLIGALTLPAAGRADA